jgi:hypothetical protein
MCIGWTMASIDRMVAQPRRAEVDGGPAPRIVVGWSDALTGDIAVAAEVV